MFSALTCVFKPAEAKAGTSAALEEGWRPVLRYAQRQEQEQKQKEHRAQITEM